MDSGGIRYEFLLVIRRIHIPVPGVIEDDPAVRIDLAHDGNVMPSVVFRLDHLHEVAHLEVFPSGYDLPALRVTTMVLQIPLGVAYRRHPCIAVHQSCLLHDVVDPAAAIRHDPFPVIDKLLLDRGCDPPPVVFTASVKPAVLIAAAVIPVEPVGPAAAMIVRPPDGVNAHDVFRDLLKFPGGLYFRIPPVPFREHAS